MNDPALSLIIDVLTEQPVNTLLLIDEQTATESLAPLRKLPQLEVVTQRYDQHQHLLQLGFNAHLNDYDFDVFNPAQFDRVAMRIGKQKAITHHVINSAPRILTPSGQLLLSGSKHEGLQSIAKKLRQIAPRVTKQRSKQQTELYIFSRYTPTNAFDDNHYTLLRPTIQTPHQHFLSKPGLFGWQKIDRGSRLLISSLASQTIQSNAHALDLGCGYGYLAVTAATEFGLTVTATDNNIAAVHACNVNLEQNGCKGVALVSHCADTINGAFDLILCNPPFHSGFRTKHTLTEQFISAAARLITDSGSAYFVVNEFIPIASIAAQYFNTISLLNEAEGFKVFCLKNA